MAKYKYTREGNAFIIETGYNKSTQIILNPDAELTYTSPEGIKLPTGAEEMNPIHKAILDSFEADERNIDRFVDAIGDNPAGIWDFYHSL